MKKIILVILFMSTAIISNAQVNIYPSSSGEMIFSFAKIKKDGNNIESNLRWSPVFNFQSLLNYDIGKTVGFFHGIGIRNVGFIYDQSADTMKKFRTYNLGIPVGIKLGNLGKGLFIYGGYEFEMPFNYKEKTFVNEDKKDKIVVWFSNRTNWYTQSLFVGLNFPGGFNLKFKYYINEFFNKNYTEAQNGNQTKPFENFNANVFYIALDWNMFKDLNSYKKNPSKKAKPENKEERFSYNYK